MSNGNLPIYSAPDSDPAEQRRALVGIAVLLFSQSPVAF